MLSVCKNPEVINLLANHPSIYPFIQHTVEGKIDLTAQVTNPNNIYLLGEYGCVSFRKLLFGVFEFHTMVLPEGRGQWAFAGGKWAFHYMFTRTDACELLTRCPDGNLASKSLVKLLGMTKLFKTLPNFKFNGKFVGCDVYSLMIQNWAINDEFITKSGEWFHDTLEEEYKRLGKNIPIHEVDETHNRYVGAAVEMIKNGQIIKGIAIYNRFAYIGGYAPISVTSENPLIIDIRDARLKVIGGHFQVI